MRIAIFGRLDDPQIVRIVTLALKRGRQLVQVAPEGWAGDGREPHTIRVARDGTISCEVGMEELFEVDAAWVRELPAVLPELDVRAGLPAIERAVLAEVLGDRAERARVVEALVHTLAALGKKVIDPPQRVLSLVLAAKAGVPVVETILTDDVDLGAPSAKSPILKQVVSGEKMRVLVVGDRVFCASNLISEIALSARRAVGLNFAAVDGYWDGREFRVSGIDAAPDFPDEVAEVLLDELSR